MKKLVNKYWDIALVNNLNVVRNITIWQNTSFQIIHFELTQYVSRACLNLENPIIRNRYTPISFLNITGGKMTTGGQTLGIRNEFRPINPKNNIDQVTATFVHFDLSGEQINIKNNQTLNGRIVYWHISVMSILQDSSDSITVSNRYTKCASFIVTFHVTS